MALVPLQTDIEKALTDFIRSELNNNSFDIFFSLGFYKNVSDAEGKNTAIMEVPDSPYETIEKKIVPMSIESYDGNITNIEGLFNADYTIPMTFQITVDDEEVFLNAIDALNEFKNKLRGQVKRLLINGEVFTAVTATDNLTPQGNITIMQGDTYAFASLSVAFDISKDINYGNQVWVYMAEFDETTGETLPNGNSGDFQRLFPLTPYFSRSETPESFQNFETTETVNIIRESEYTYGMTIFVKDDDFHWNLLENVVNKTSLNKPYRLLLEFKRYDENAQLETKFSFDDVVVITDAQPTFAIGEPQYIELSMSKYLSKSEIVPGGDIPGLPILETPEYVADSITTAFTNITDKDDVLGVYATMQFTNTSTENTADMKVCVGSQCDVEADVAPGETRTFNFTGLLHSTNYTAVASLVGDGQTFNNSEEITEPFTTISVAEPSNLTKTIGTPTSTGFPFAVENPNLYPIEVFVEYQGTLSQPFLVQGNTQAQFNYVNENIPTGTNVTFNLVYSTLSEFGTVLTYDDATFTLAIPAIPRVLIPALENFEVVVTDVDATVTFDVRNRYSEPVNLYVNYGNVDPTSSNFDFSALNVPAAGQPGDTVSFTQVITDAADFGSFQVWTAIGTSEGALDSFAGQDGIAIPNLITKDLDVVWNATDELGKVSYTVTNNSTYFNRFDIGLYLNGVFVPNSLRSTNSALYTGIEPGQFITFDFIDGDNDPGEPDLVIDGDGVNDVYELGVITKSDGRDNTTEKKYEGFLARPTVLPAIFSIETTSNVDNSFIRFRLRNLEGSNARVYYGVSTSTSPFTLNNFVSLGAAGTSSADSNFIQYTVNSFDLNDNHYIHAYADGTTSVHLLQSGRIISGAITPADLQDAYTVRFIDYDGTVLKEETVLQGDDATPPNDPTRTGYTFTGWDEDFENVQSNLDVNAVYEAIEYTITYVLNGATNNPLNPSTYTTEQIITFQDASRDYYDFIGWYTDAAFTQEITQLPEGSLGNKTIYAKLEQITLDNYVVTVTDTEIDSITISITNPSSNPSDSTAAAYIALRDSSGNFVDVGTTYNLPRGTSDTKTFTGLDDNTTYEIGGNGTNNAIVTVDTQGNYLSNEQAAIDETTPENIGDKTLRVKFNRFGTTETATVSWSINGVSQSGITANTNTFTTFTTTLFDSDEISITAPQTLGGTPFQNFTVDGTTKSGSNFGITETVGDGLDIEINYF